jgi:hypothetical protein
MTYDQWNIDQSEPLLGLRSAAHAVPLLVARGQA